MFYMSALKLIGNKLHQTGAARGRSNGRKGEGVEVRIELPSEERMARPHPGPLPRGEGDTLDGLLRDWDSNRLFVGGSEIENNL